MRIINYWTESQQQMITDDGNVKRYIDSDIVDNFEIGDCADLSFPNGYNKYYRVFKKICPCLCVLTAKYLCVKVRGRSKMNEDYAVRRLVPKECFRLQGMKDEDYDKLKDKLSDTQQYKIAGNGLTVNVMSAIFKQMLD